MCLRYSSSVVAPTALAAGEHRLQQVGGVDGTLGGACADDRVELVDEEDDVAGRVLDLLENGLEPFLELATVLRPGEERAHVERPRALSLQPLGDVAGDDPLCEPLDDRGLAYARLADQDGVVLRPPERTWITRRTSSSRPMTGSSLPASASAVRSRPYFSSAWYVPLGILRSDILPAADVLERLEQRLTRDDVEREQEVLDRGVLVAQSAHLLEGLVEHSAERRRGLRLRAAARDRWLVPHACLCLGAARLRRSLHDRRAFAAGPVRAARRSGGRA